LFPNFACMQQSIYDLVIVGAGPIGLACAIEAKRNGLRALILEKGTLVNSLYRYPVNMTFFSTSERLEIGGVPFVSNNVKPTRNEALEYYRRVAVSNQLDIHLFEEVKGVKKIANVFNVQTAKDKYHARNIVIASGFYGIPNMLGVPGEALPKVTHYYSDPHLYAFQKVLVIGANNSGVDAALETMRKGAAVTMVVRGPEIGTRVKYWVRPDIINRIDEGSIKAYFNSTIIAIHERSVDIQTPTGIVTIENDRVIAMTGYQPDLSFLQSLGINLAEDEIRTPAYDMDTYETNIEGIYLAGVICGGMNTHSLFIENSREHAVKIISSILNKQSN
jgi:thioredoxin reductase (NADPH)